MNDLAEVCSLLLICHEQETANGKGAKGPRASTLMTVGLFWLCYWSLFLYNRSLLTLFCAYHEQLAALKTSLQQGPKLIQAPTPVTKRSKALQAESQGLEKDVDGVGKRLATVEAQLASKNQILESARESLWENRAKEGDLTAKAQALAQRAAAREAAEGVGGGTAKGGKAVMDKKKRKKMQRSKSEQQFILDNVAARERLMVVEGACAAVARTLEEREERAQIAEHVANETIFAAKAVAKSVGGSEAQVLVERMKMLLKTREALASDMQCAHLAASSLGAKVATLFQTVKPLI